jgi:hypothetical protein
VFPYLLVHGGIPAYENVYRPEKVDSGDSNSIIGKLLPTKCICKDLLLLLQRDY